MKEAEAGICKFWGKLGQGQYPDAAHPAVCQMLDVAHVAAEYFAHSLQDSMRRALPKGRALAPIRTKLREPGPPCPAARRPSEKVPHLGSA